MFCDKPIWNDMVSLLYAALKRKLDYAKAILRRIEKSN